MDEAYPCCHSKLHLMYRHIGQYCQKHEELCEFGVCHHFERLLLWHANLSLVYHTNLTWVWIAQSRSIRTWLLFRFSRMVLRAMSWFTVRKICFFHTWTSLTLCSIKKINNYIMFVFQIMFCHWLRYMTMWLGCLISYHIKEKWLFSRTLHPHNSKTNTRHLILFKLKMFR